MDAADAQEVLLQRVAQAAAAGDPFAMLEALGESRIVDGLVRRLGGKWPALDQEECYSAVSEAVDSLYATVSNGKRVFNIPSFLWKVADRSAFDLDSHKKRTVPTEPSELERMVDGLRPTGQEKTPTPPDNETDTAAEHRRADGIARLRQLVPLCGGPHIQTVLNYILDGIAVGREDVTNTELEHATGLSASTVRTSKSRGLQRLEARARQLSGAAVMLAELGTNDPDGS